MSEITYSRKILNEKRIVNFPYFETPAFINAVTEKFYKNARKILLKNHVPKEVLDDIDKDR